LPVSTTACALSLRSESRAGFVLAAVLWVLAILALIAAYAVSWVGAGIERGFITRARVGAVRQAEEARATALYWLTTRYLSHRGIEIVSGPELAAAQDRDVFSAAVAGNSYIALDDRPYRSGAGQIRLQDGHGLLPVGRTSPSDWSAVLGAVGVPEEERAPLIARLHDYLDPGASKTLNGAAISDYQAAGRPIPSGAPMATPWELRQVLTWDSLDHGGFASSPVYEILTEAPTPSGGTPVLNLNTAPPAVLAVLPGLDGDAIAKLVAARTQQPFNTTAQAELVSGVPLPSALHQFLFLPADSLRLSMTADDAPLERVMSIRLTPTAADRPWQVGYMLDLPLFPDHHFQNATDVLDLPDPARLSPASQRG
jgi:general secretion pathway protein K